MKLDFIITSLNGGGAERVMVILANNFAKIGYEVKLITFYGKPDGDAYSLHHNVKRIELHGGKFKNHKIRSLNNLYQFYKKKENRPDIIISFLIFTNLISILVAKLHNIRIISSEHINHLEGEQPMYLTKFTRNLVYRMSDIVTVLTKFDVEYYKKRKANVVVMPNPCSFVPIKENNHARDKEILAVGSLDRYHHKGFDNLIELITPVLKANPEWILKIIGGGDKGRFYLESLIKESNIEKQIVFTGFQNNVSEHMKKGSIFILSSRFEGLPMVLLEAMSQGMTCIAYNCKTGPSDIITHSSNGILVEDQNKSEMQKELLNLMNNRDLRASLSKNAINSLSSFSLDEITNKWENLFKITMK